MRAFLVLGISMASMCSSSLGTESAATTSNWGVDASGCKLAISRPVDGAQPIFKFTGTCVDGFIAGTGEVTMLDGSGEILRGEFVQGRLVKGVVESRSGVYEGDLLDNVPHGQGTFKAHNGLVFKGTFEKGRRAGSTAEVTWPGEGRYAGGLDPRSLSPLGKGIMYYIDGSVLAGEFMEGEKAVGVLKHVDGTVSQGVFVSGRLMGQGKIEWLSGARYEGEVRASQPSGRGHMERPTGEIYDGEFADGYYHGKGTYRTGRGDVYVGDFVLGKRHGSGELKHGNGDVQAGEWRDDLLHGKCRIVTATEKYEGSCSGGTRDGYGRWESSRTKRIYEGNFKADQFDGKGKLTTRTPGGDPAIVYEGEFSDSLMEGRGVLRIGGLKLDGTFKADEFIRGTVSAGDGRVFEVDNETGDVLEILKDGSKRSLDQLPTDITI